MKRIIALASALVILLSAALFVCVAYAVSADTIVCVTPTGEKYHKIGCSYIRNQYYTLTIGEAARLGYTPCSRCKPGYPDTDSATQGQQKQTPTYEQQPIGNSQNSVSSPKQNDNTSVNVQTENEVSASEALVESENKYQQYANNTTHETYQEPQQEIPPEVTMKDVENGTIRETVSAGMQQEDEVQGKNGAQETSVQNWILPNWFLYLVSGYIVLRVILLLRSAAMKKDSADKRQ